LEEDSEEKDDGRKSTPPSGKSKGTKQPGSLKP
jgi:hypothetical protein